MIDQNGKFLASWSQFSHPSGCYIDSKDNLKIAIPNPTYHHPPSGARIGSVKEGVVVAFNPDGNTDKMGTNNDEGTRVDTNAVIFDAELGQRAAVRYYNHYPLATALSLVFLRVLN
jgi:hypothetical protein